MSARKKLVLWSSFSSSQFVVGSSEDLRLYELKDKVGKKVPSFSFSLEADESETTKKSILVSVNNSIQHVKCLAWSTDSSDPGLVAAGATNGKVVLTSFTLPHTIFNMDQSYAPKHSRNCNSLAWNSVNKHNLAVGLDKVRQDYSILIWDVNRGKSSGAEKSSKSVNYTTSPFDFKFSGTTRKWSRPASVHKKPTPLTTDDVGSDNTVPLSCLANSESIVALSWLPNKPDCLAAGTGVKWLRVYDLRDSSNTPPTFAHQKAVRGVKFDPYDENYLMTYSEDTEIKIWDIRQLKQPTLTIHTNNRTIQQVEWCPTRKGIISSITKDEHIIKLWDTKHARETELGSMELDKPYKTCHSQDAVSSVSWHPTSEFKMLSVTRTGIVELVSLSESIPVIWTPSSCLSFGSASQVVEASVEVNNKYLDPENIASREDFISVVIQERVLQEYGLDFDKNIDILETEFEKLRDSENEEQKIEVQKLATLWQWMKTLSNFQFSVSENEKKKENSEENVDIKKFRGIVDILGISEAEQIPTIASSMEQFEKHMFFNVYRSQKRDLSRKICGWDFETEAELDQVLTTIEEDGDFERAAAIAVFCLDLRRGIKSLQKGQLACKEKNPEREFNLRLVAMALAGYGDGKGNQKDSLWRETTESFNSTNSDVYLQTMFDFLCSRAEDFPDVLHRSEINLRDKIAFACRFLNDSKLKNYLANLKQNMIENGDLDGLILTGLTQEGVDIFENYVNRTCDIQTATLCLISVIPNEFEDKRVEIWTENYRELLDVWQLWDQRATFDIDRASLSQIKPDPQVFARCNFCHQNLALTGIVPGRIFRQMGRIPRRGGESPFRKSKMSGCPNCKKPLPRCSLCLMSLECGLPAVDRQVNTVIIEGKEGIVHPGNLPFEQWFTWCQTCRHGGHLKHIQSWFETNTECPVTDCHCKCASI